MAETLAARLDSTEISSLVLTDSLPTLAGGVAGMVKFDKLRNLLQSKFTNLTATNLTLGGDAILEREAADALGQRRGTNGQVYRVYGTWSDASNYERLALTRAAIAVETAGTGADNIDLALVPAGTGAVVVTAFIRNPDAGELTIATGAITVTGTYHTVDTQNDDASDVLDAIAGGVDGAQLILQAEHTDRTVVVTRSSTIKLSAATITLGDTESIITFIYSGALSAWIETSSSTNA